MANHIQNLQDKVNSQAKQIDNADNALQIFRAYLATPKFTGENELSGYISIQDVEARLGEIWRALHGLD